MHTIQMIALWYAPLLTWTFPHTSITPRPTWPLPQSAPHYVMLLPSRQNSMYKIYKMNMYRHIHLHTHVSMSSRYVSFVRFPVYPPNTTALWWSTLVKVCQASGGGSLPVDTCCVHIPIGRVRDHKLASLSGPLDQVEGSINTIPYVVVCGCGHAVHLIHLHVNDWNANSSMVSRSQILSAKTNRAWYTTNEVNMYQLHLCFHRIVVQLSLLIHLGSERWVERPARYGFDLLQWYYMAKKDWLFQQWYMLHRVINHKD